MGFAPQPNTWECGPFALKHALVMLGIFADEKEISRIARADKAWGADETQLARAARRFDCDLTNERAHEPDEAKGLLLEYLGEGIPCLVCVQEWSHWVTVVKEEKGKFILLDSREKAVWTTPAWNQFKKLWVYHQKDANNRDIIASIYDFNPVVPRFRVQTRAMVSLSRARYLRRPENREFARQWDNYVEDLLALCKPRTALSANVLSLGEFLRRHGEMVLDQVAFWHGWVERPRAAKILKNLRFVADTYGLVIHEENEKRAIAGITALLTLWAGGRYGVTPVYQEIPKKPRRRRTRK